MSLHPRELRVSKDRKTLTVSFEEGDTFALSAEYLRVESPSAEVQGHSPTERKFIAGKKDVGIMTIDPVGSYAIKITFDDLHSTGIYAWDYLHKLGVNHAKIWAKYEDGLAHSGGSREKLTRR
jgi:DUF971 family protein